MRLLKKKWFLFGLSIQLAALSFFPFIQRTEAAGYDAGGFIIEADRVIGENMKATIVSGETSGSKARPLLRITYDSAEIHGMKLTKQFQTAGGVVSITMKARGPVRINGMQVDTSAISFKGACIHAAKIIPNAALEGVTMVAHSMNAADSSLDKLQLQTVNGDGGVKKPGPLKILQDLSAMPFAQMEQEIEKVTSGQLPLTCDAPEEEEGPLDEAGKPLEEAAEPIKEVVEEVADPVKDTVDKVTDPVTEVVDGVTGPIKKVTDPVTGPVKDTVKKVTDPVIDEVNKRTEPVKETVRKTTETVRTVTEPIVEPVRKTVDQTAATTCEKAAAANGRITKELGIELVDKALKENKTLDELCPADTTLTKQLESWTEGFLDSLGLLSLIGLKPSEEDQLKKMRDALLKEPDGAIIEFD